MAKTSLTTAEMLDNSSVQILKVSITCIQVSIMHVVITCKRHTGSIKMWIVCCFFKHFLLAHIIHTRKCYGPLRRGFTGSGTSDKIRSPWKHPCGCSQRQMTNTTNSLLTLKCRFWSLCDCITQNKRGGAYMWAHVPHTPQCDDAVSGHANTSTKTTLGPHTHTYIFIYIYI